MRTTNRYVEEFSRLVRVEQQLQNAAGEIQVAQIRLASDSPLRGEFQRLYRALEDTVSHTREAKQALLAAWRMADEETRAAA